MSLGNTNLVVIGALLLVSSVTGCSDNNAAKPAMQQAAVDSYTSQDRHTTAGHSHGAGPHGGTIIDWGGGTYHVELTVDHEKQEAIAYLLGNDEKTPAPITGEEIHLNIKSPAMEITLKAAPQDGDPEGTASRFVGNHESLVTVREYEGTIMGVVEDTPYSGNFKEEPHGLEQ